MNWDGFRARLSAAVAACEALNATVSEPSNARSTRLVVEPPATGNEIDAAEQALGLQLPERYREALARFARSLDMFWFLRNELTPPLRGMFAGRCGWSLAGLPTLEHERRARLKLAFPDPTNEDARVWHHALLFEAVGNGDFIAFDLSPPRAPVIFVSARGTQMHGWRLADDFQDYLERSSRLAFVGLEDWQLEPFLVSATAGLITDSANAREWRQWFGYQG